jgi:hypothetical protein
MKHQDPVNLVDISHLKRIKGMRSNSTPLVIKLMSLIWLTDPVVPNREKYIGG